ncbi:MAG: flagellar basal body P-ring formation protein FlgA [Variovorax sp.]|nr:MAG: flagellar basal body P-ring formation protein FlgA [Variovorax sp.]
MENALSRTRLVLHALHALPAWLACLGAAACLAATPQAGDAHAVIRGFLQTQTAGLPGKVEISFGTASADALPPCDALEPFLPAGATAWGRVSVGLRCRGDKPWTRFVQAHVAVQGRYLVAARAIAAGQALGAGDVDERSGDLTRLPPSVLTDAAELHGVVATNRIAAGAPLRRELVRGVVVIRQGQAVQVIAEGAGFVVSTEGRALAQAAVGATVQAKTRDGRLVSGVADEDGRIRLP